VRMNLRWDAVTLDCRDPQTLAAFWCALLDVEVRGTWEQYVGLHPMRPGQPRLSCSTDDPRPAKNTLHLDLHVPSVAELPAAVERAIGLGARLVEEHNEDGASWRTMADPEGNLFCLVAD
jgi:catechol 2,3-dioxygenase-like lactoylglutathione lyase family enzyme